MRLHSGLKSILYRVDSDNPYNKRVAEVWFDMNNRVFRVGMGNPDVYPGTLGKLEAELATEQEAMELAVATLVNRRFDHADKSLTERK